LAELRQASNMGSQARRMAAPDRRSLKNIKDSNRKHKKTSTERKAALKEKAGIIKEKDELIQTVQNAHSAADAMVDKLERQLVKYVQLQDIHETVLQDLETMRQELQKVKEKKEKREIIEFKDKRGAYHPQFRQMVGMALLEGLPNSCAERVLRRVLEFAYNCPVGDLGSHKTRARFTMELETIMHALIYATTTGVNKDGVIDQHQTWHHDETNKFGQSITGSHIVVNGEALSLGVQACIDKSAYEQLNALTEKIDDITRDGELLIGPLAQRPNPNRLILNITQAVTDGGKADLKMNRDMVERKTTINVNGPNGIVSLPCHMHITSGMVEGMKKAQANVCGEANSCFTINRTMDKGYRLQSNWGHSAGRKYDSYTMLRDKTNRLAKLKPVKGMRVHNQLRNCEPVLLDRASVVNFINEAATKAVRKPKSTAHGKDEKNETLQQQEEEEVNKLHRYLVLISFG